MIRLTKFSLQKLWHFVSAGVAIPDDAIVQYSHLAQKAELAARLRQDPSEEQMQMMQMQQQLAMQEAQLQVAKLEAEVRKLQSEAAVNVSRKHRTLQMFSRN